MLNKVILIGEIVSEPELRYFKDNSVITILKIMTQEKINNITQKTWHRVVMNKKNKELKKNMLVIVNGKIKTRRWLEQNKYNYITEIFAEEIKEIDLKIIDKKKHTNNENENDVNYSSDYYNSEKNEKSQILKEEKNENDNKNKEINVESGDDFSYDENNYE